METNQISKISER